MFKKFLTLVIALVAVFAFTACKEETKKPVDDTKKPDNEVIVDTNVGKDETDDENAIDYDEGLSTERYDGYNYRMLVRKGEIDEFAPVEEQADTVKAAVFRRNKAIEEKYGITITASESSSNTSDTDALNVILAGDDAYDIVFSQSRSSFAYAVQGAAYNINDIESINLEKPWWSEDAVDAFDINDNLYILDGDITNSLKAAMVLYFNKDIFDELGFDYPYETVLDGDWTFDEFAYYVKKGGQDLTGDGVLNPGEDRYGFYSHEWSAPINVLYAGGQKIFNKNDEGELTLTLNSTKTVDIFQEFFSLMNNEACFLHMTTEPKNYNGDTGFFSKGLAMFESSTLSAAEGFRNMDDDFGILPYPKFDEDDEYTTTINGNQVFAIIPITVPDVERTGAITEALAAYSAKEVTPAFYDISLKNKYSRDEESAVMMDIIKDSIIYDIGYFNNTTFSSIGRDLSKTATRDFSSFYASKESSATSSLKSFNEDYGHIE